MAGSTVNPAGPSGEADGRRVRAGIVGVGSHCQRNILPALRHVPVDVRACCDIDIARAKQVSASYGIPRAYDDIEHMVGEEELDAVFLAVGPIEHPALALAALRAGVHVWLEKPPAARVADLDAIRAAQGDRVVVVGFKKAFMPATQKAIELLADTAYGPLRSMVGIYPLTVPDDGPQALAENRRTGWLANGCHPLSAMLAVGGPVGSVTWHGARHGGGVCVLEFVSGAIGTLHLAHGAPTSQPVERYEFFGEDSRVAIENGLRVVWQRAIPFRYGQTTTYSPPGTDHGAVVWEPQNMLATLENQPLFTQGFVGSLEHFCRCVLDGSQPTIGNLGFAREVMSVYEGVLSSGGARIELPTLNKAPTGIYQAS